MSLLRSESTWAVVAIVGVVCHAVLFGLLHWLEPQLSPKSSIISDYYETDSVRIAVTAFVVFAAIWLSLALALSGVSAASTLLFAGRVLLVLAAISILVGAFVPSTMDPRTGSALARFQNLVSRPGLFLAIILVSLGLRAAPGWSDLWPSLLTLSSVAVVVLAVTIIVLLERGLGGIGQRAIFLLIYAYVLLVSIRILRLDT